MDNLPPPEEGGPLVNSDPPQATEEDRIWAVVAHASLIVALLVSAGILTPVFPLILYYIKKDSSPFAAHAAKQAIGLSISILIVSLVMIVIGCLTLGFALIIIVPLAAILSIAYFVFIIIAMIQVSKGVPYQYPIIGDFTESFSL